MLGLERSLDDASRNLVLPFVICSSIISLRALALAIISSVSDVPLDPIFVQKIRICGNVSIFIFFQASLSYLENGLNESNS